MALKQFTFAYGHGTKTFDYEESDILKVVRTEDFPPMQNIKQGVLDAISNPIGSPASARSGEISSAGRNE